MVTLGNYDALPRATYARRWPPPAPGGRHASRVDAEHATRARQRARLVPPTDSHPEIRQVCRHRHELGAGPERRGPWLRGHVVTRVDGPGGDPPDRPASQRGVARRASGRQTDTAAGRPEDVRRLPLAAEAAVQVPEPAVGRGKRLERERG